MSAARRLIGAALVALLAVWAVPASGVRASGADEVAADDGNNPSGDPGEITNPDVDGGGESDGDEDEAGEPEAEPPSCEGQPEVPDEPPPAAEGTVMGFGDEIRRRVRVYDCLVWSPENDTSSKWHLVWVTIGSLGEFTDEVVAHAIAKVPKPQAGFWPALDPWTYVNMETAVWVDNVDWSVPFSDSDTQFGITVTVDVWPESLAFDPGDGSEVVVCTSAGIPRVGPSGGGCSHIYLRSSAGQAGLVYPGSVAVNYRVEITRTLGGDETRSFSNSSEYAIAVAEIQTVVES